MTKKAKAKVKLKVKLKKMTPKTNTEIQNQAHPVVLKVKMKPMKNTQTEDIKSGKKNRNNGKKIVKDELQNTKQNKKLVNCLKKM